MLNFVVGLNHADNRNRSIRVGFLVPRWTLKKWSNSQRLEKTIVLMLNFVGEYFLSKSRTPTGLR